MGNPFVHIELNTDDVETAKQFYKKLFDWKLSDAGMGYTLLDVGKRGAGGGMQKKPMPEAPNNWLPYVEVDDVQKTLAKAEQAGARVIAPFMAIGDMGAIAVLADPTGTAFGIWAQTKKPAKKPARKAARKPARKPAKKPARKAKKAGKR